MSRVREERSISELTDDNIEETSPARTPEHKFRYKKNGKGTSHFSGDVMSLPYNTQRKLIKAMYKLCFESAFYFTKRYTLPLTLNVESPFSPVTRLTIQDLTDAILDAYNKSTIPNTAVEEDVGFGFAAVFTAAIALDDALMYFDKSLSDRRIRSILLTGVDLVNVLKDEQAIDAAESIIAETEEKIEHVRRKSWEGESVAASMAASMADTDVDMSGDEKDDEVEDEDTMGDVPTPTSTSATEETRTSNRTVTENGNGGAASNDSSNTV